MCTFSGATAIQPYKLTIGSPMGAYFHLAHVNPVLVCCFNSSLSSAHSLCWVQKVNFSDQQICSGICSRNWSHTLRFLPCLLHFWMQIRPILSWPAMPFLYGKYSPYFYRTWIRLKNAAHNVNYDQKSTFSNLTFNHSWPYAVRVCIFDLMHVDLTPYTLFLCIFWLGTRMKISLCEHTHRRNRGSWPATV